MSQHLCVLMYHAVVVDGRLPLGADPHYAVELAAFRRQLDLIAAEGRRGAHLAQALDGDDSLVALTFDDGDDSNVAAADELARRGWSATFFVNPSTVGTPGFLSWEDLRRMVAQGMSIQSHGMHHRFLDELPADEVIRELAASRAAIEAGLGTSVTVYAPAGGRMPSGFAEVARAQGYEVLCTSVADVWSRRRGDRWAVPRFAVLAGTTDVQLRRWVRADGVERLRQQLRHGLLTAAKRCLGNGRYQRLRAAMLGRFRGAA